MDDLQNQDLVDDQLLQDISGAAQDAADQAPAEEPAPLAPPPVAEPAADPAPIPAPVVDAEEATPEPVPAPIPAPLPAPEVIESPEETKVPSVHDLGLLDKDKEEASDDTKEEATPVAMPSSISLTEDAGATPEDEELNSLKKQALEQLSPLLGNLDLPPEQKFDTYMEVIRASDDKNLVQPAFEAAKAIVDEDKKAQALLDVVNEVNYLTQDHKDSA